MRNYSPCIPILHFKNRCDRLIDWDIKPYNILVSGPLCIREKWQIIIGIIYCTHVINLTV